MLLKLDLWAGAALLGMSLGAIAQTVPVTPGSAAAYVLKPVRVQSATMDTTPPNTTGLSISNITATSALLTAAINEAGTGYYLKRLATDPIPDVNTVYSTGAPLAMAANTAVTANLLGLTVNTNYKIDFVAKDQKNNLQTTVSTVAFSTDVTPPVTKTGDPTVSNTTDTSTTLSVTINEAGTGIYLMKLASDPGPPSVNDMKNIGIGFAMSGGVAANVLISDLTPSTNYLLYFIAKDTNNNMQASVVSVPVNTLADQCLIAASSSIVNTCCQSPNSEHKLRGRATEFLGAYKAAGSFASLGAAGDITYLKKTAAGYLTAGTWKKDEPGCP